MLSEVRAELEDRYGEMPVSVQHLLEAAACACNASGRAWRRWIASATRSTSALPVRPISILAG